MIWQYLANFYSFLCVPVSHVALQYAAEEHYVDYLFVAKKYSMDYNLDLG